MKLLLGGIPLGCDNIGDEAILACVVKIMRRNFPNAELSVCTREREATEKLLNVQSEPLFGFDPGEANSIAAFERRVKNYDCFIWAGATGLSDYPMIGASLLEAAHRAGVPAVVWSVGMDSKFNPVFFKVAGKRKIGLRIASWCTLGVVDFVRRYEAFLVRRIRQRLQAALTPCRLVTLRDFQSAEELTKTGFRSALVGADSAILQESAPEEQNPLSPAPESVRTIGLCISAQRALVRQDKLVAFLDSLLEHGSTRVVFIPMNPQTDYALMKKLQQQLKHAEQTILLQNIVDPAQVQAAASRCDVVISSRLHLLILAGNVNVPIIGISRGSKVDNFLANYQLKSVGDVARCDFEALRKQINWLTTSEVHSAFERNARFVHESLLSRLEMAEKKLRNALQDLEKTEQK